MTRFIMLCGLPGAGKSTWAENYINQDHNSCVISSDTVRSMYFDGVTDQEHNPEVFKLMLNLSLEMLNEGKTVIYDATNIKRKFRMHTLNIIKNAIDNVVCEGVVFTPTVEQCIKNDSARERTVGSSVIINMLKRWETPGLYEGFDTIYLVNKHHVEVADLLDSVENFNQHNSHHTKLLSEHMKDAAQFIFDSRIKFDELYYAALLHDIGKPICKSFYTATGKYTEGEAHYRNHANVGAYIVLTIRPTHIMKQFVNLSDNCLLLISQYVLFHMEFFGNRINKIRNLIGDKMFSELEMLHNADVSSH